MSIATAITNAQGKVANAYTALSNKGATLPATQDLSNIPSTINTITTLNGTTLSVTPSTSAQSFAPTSPYNAYTSVSAAAVTSSIDANIQAGNIKNGVTILGVTGNYSGTTPTGTLPITENGVYDVTNYASVDVNVSGGGGGSGYKLTVDARSNYGGRYKVWINGEVAIDSNQTTFNSYHTIIFHNVENFEWEIIDGYYEPGSWDGAWVTVGGVTTLLTSGQVFTLTGDATLKVENYSCLTGDTLVTMWDRTTKRIDEVAFLVSAVSSTT